MRIHPPATRPSRIPNNSGLNAYAMIAELNDILVYYRGKHCTVHEDCNLDAPFCDRGECHPCEHCTTCGQSNNL